MNEPKKKTAIHPESSRERRLMGIALMCGANLTFATNDTIAKFLVRDMSALQVGWARFVGALVMAVLISNVLFHPERTQTQRPYAQLARSILLVTANLPMMYALRYLQLDQTASIMFMSPFIVAALAVPLLGEQIGPRRWAAIGVGFCGVLLVMRPGFGTHPAVFLCLISAFSYSFYSILTRIVSHTDSSMTTLFHTNIAGSVIMSLIIPFVWTTPTMMGAVLMAAMGVVTGFGHYLLIAAHRMAPASVLSPFMYTQLVWMIFYGFVVFADLPNYWTIAGASVVIASGLYLLYRERQVKGPAGPVSGDPIA
jgi:drug/metabolite transporter (DMT)-like permease